MRNLYYAVVGLKAYGKQFKENKVTIKPTKKNLLQVINVEGKKLSVHYVPDINKMGVAFGALYHNAITKKNCFLVDDYFIALTNDIQDAMLAHEIGHYVLNHHRDMGLIYMFNHLVFLGKLQCSSGEEKNLLIASTLKNRDYSQELEADAFAIERCGKDAVVKMLQRMVDTVPCPESYARYEHITGERVKSPLEALIGNCKTMSIDDI